MESTAPTMACDEQSMESSIPEERHAPHSLHLNNSFDASMLHSSESDSNKLPLRQAASWDASQPRQQELPPLCLSTKKTVVRSRLCPPSTIIKKKLTPASVKRQRTAQRKSPRQRNKILLDPTNSLDEPVLVRKRAPKDSLGTYTTAATSTLLDETIDSADDSSAAMAASATAPFRFTSFPSSLPRIAQQTADGPLRDGADSIRKRMSFGGLSFMNQQPVPSMDDCTNNTSLSSVGYESDNSHHETAGEEEDSNCSSLLGTPVLRTRLNFNAMLSPRMGHTSTAGQLLYKGKG